MRIFALSLLTTLFFSQIHAEEKGEKQQIKQVHFIRDVMQPLGAPVVESFHNMRENQFFNMHFHDAEGLEAVGDFFLAPSRYLFAGKTLKFTETDPQLFTVKQSFCYKKMHWLKTTLSLLVLPFSEVIGATFKGLSYLSRTTRKKQRAVRAALKAPFVQSNLESYHNIGIEQTHSISTVPCLDYKRPSRLTKKQKAEIQALKEITSLLEEHEIIHWVDFGTCLGAYRYGGIIPWDWDIDISILLPDHENVKRVLSQLDPKKYQVQDWSSYSNPGTFLKVLVKETKNYVDIMHYRIDSEKQDVSYFFTYEHSPMPYSWKKDELKGMKPVHFTTLFPLKRAQFDGLTVWAPNDVVTYLQSKYEDNLEPSNIWDEESQCYRKVKDHPYWSKGCGKSGPTKKGPP